MKKFYAVRAGRDTGIFSSWEECKAQVHGFAGAEFKSFADERDAERYMKFGKSSESAAEANGTAAYVDGSFRDGASSYGCVILRDGKVVKELSGSDDRFPESRNIYGEVSAVRKALEWALENNIPAITIYYDYSGIEKWAVSEWKANSDVSREYKEYMEMIAGRISISFKKVTAHSGNFFNERADKLAREALPKKETEKR
jgi:ribonuclease HI